MTTAPTRQQIMSDMFVNNTGVGDRKLKTTNTNFHEVEICRGDAFVGVVKRTGVTTDNTFYSVITTGAKYLLVDDLAAMVNFNVGDGDFLFEMHAYVDISNANTWSYAGGTQAPLGKPLHTGLVNNTPVATIEVGVTATVTGEDDYHLFDQQLTRDTSGNRSTSGSISATIFAGNRVIVISPNSKVLIRSDFTGVDGDANITTMFYFKELTAAEFPQSEDI